MASDHHLLFYDYVDDIAERRRPHRDGHLDLIRRWKDAGLLLMAGAVGDPPHGALFVFEVSEPEEIDAFVNSDPYVHAGLVTAHRVEPWRTV